MAMSPCKSLILLALLLAAFFFSTTAATGRSFGVMESDRLRYEKSGESEFRPKAAPPPEEEEGVGDLAEDYTPPRKKPPIHN